MSITKCFIHASILLNTFNHLFCSPILYWQPANMVRIGLLFGDFHVHAISKIQLTYNNSVKYQVMAANLESSPAANLIYNTLLYKNYNRQEWSGSMQLTRNAYKDSSQLAHTHSQPTLAYAQLQDIKKISMVANAFCAENNIGIFLWMLFSADALSII